MSYLEEKIYILIGFAGVGKSYWGEQINQKFGFNWKDTDKEIEYKLQMPIHTIFERQGEDSFRKLEREMLHFLINSAYGAPTVITTGGGLPCYEDNMQFMKKNATVIWLDSPKEHLFERLSKSKSRPLTSKLSKEELYTYIDETLAKRIAFYQQADYKISDPISLEKFQKILAIT